MHNHLTKDDRIGLEILLKAGHSIRDCARQLGFSAGAISKEIAKNGSRDNYRGRLAHKRYLKTRKRANQCHREFGSDECLTGCILTLLADDWSPEQIVGRVGLELGITITSATSIYNYINPRKELHHLLPRKCNKYRRTKAGNERKKLREELSTKRSIDERPAEVNEKKRIGDHEGDTIVGKERTARILTDVERTSGYLLAELLLDVTAEKIKDSQVQLFDTLPEDKKHTLTLDNGVEFPEYELLEKEAGIKIYFAHPYHSWERGANENANGLIRRYFPKGTVFSTIDAKYFKEVINKINHRPRKRLGWRTPHEVFWGVNIRTLI